jgi:nicotinamidase-related amidase
MDSSGTAVLVIDMQKAYFEAEALRSRQDEVVAACNRLVAAAAANDVPVLLVCTEHERDKSTWTLSMLDDDQGFIFSGSEQAEFVDGLRHEGLPRMVKTRDSAFMGTDLLLRLRNFGAGRLVLAGVATHNCVAQTAADAFANNFRVVYAADAMASTNEEYADAMRSILSDEYRQPVLGVAEVEKLLAGSGKPQ